MNKVYDIIIVDDHKDFLDGLELFLLRDLQYNIIGKFISAKELLSSNLINQADLILMDVEMPEINGIEAAKKIIWETKDKKLIAITMYSDGMFLDEIISSGFKGCICKDEICSDLKPAINAVFNNKYYISTKVKNLKFDKNLR